MRGEAVGMQVPGDGLSLRCRVEGRMRKVAMHLSEDLDADADTLALVRAWCVWLREDMK